MLSSSPGASPDAMLNSACSCDPPAALDTRAITSAPDDVWFCSPEATDASADTPDEMVIFCLSEFSRALPDTNEVTWQYSCDAAGMNAQEVVVILCCVSFNNEYDRHHFLKRGVSL